MKTKLIHSLLSAMVFFFALMLEAQALDAMRAPNASGNLKPHRANLINPVQFVFMGMVQTYQQFISPADGPRSPSYPTGSAYSLQAIQKHGVFMGVILTADRLLHESGAPLSPILRIHGVSRVYDPLIWNTFWHSERIKP